MPSYNHSHAEHHHPSKGKGFRFSRREKLIIHFFLIIMIALSLMTEGGKLADWSFLLLAIIVEVS